MGVTAERFRLLLVEADDCRAERILGELKRSGFELSLRRAQTTETLAEELRAPFDLVICADSVPMLDVPAVLEAVRKSSPDVPVIVVAAALGADAAVEIMRGGAKDCVLAGDLSRLGAAVTRELRAGRASAAVAMRQTAAGELDRVAAIGALVSGVGHEISNPLACILANLEFVGDELQMLLGELPTEASRRLEQRITELSVALDDTRHAAERARAILQDLRAFASDDDGSVGQVDVGAITDASLRMSAIVLRRRATIVKDYADVPPVVGNDSRLVQVCLSLVLHAAHALPEGLPGDNRLEIGIRLEGAMVVLEIVAAAPAISKDAVPRLESSLTRSLMGRGRALGLHTCRHLVTALGGDLTVKSEPGRVGFVVSLPPAA